MRDVNEKTSTATQDAEMNESGTSEPGSPWYLDVVDSMPVPMAALVIFVLLWFGPSADPTPHHWTVRGLTIVFSLLVMIRGVREIRPILERWNDEDD